MSSHPLAESLDLLRLPANSLELKVVFKVVQVVELGLTHWVGFLQLQLTFLGLHVLRLWSELNTRLLQDIPPVDDDWEVKPSLTDYFNEKLILVVIETLRFSSDQDV